ncbi:MAG: methyl-accepting chemotaxis protein [Bacteroidota bacterium]|nr:methyl-accepting chemotaxis protein [Bacteroidota bacterium]
MHIRLIKNSLQAKIIIIFSILLLSLSVVNFFYSYKKQRSDSIDFATKHVQTFAKMLAFSVGSGLGESNFDIVQTAFNWAKGDKNIVYIDIIDETNSSIVTHNPENIKIGKDEIISSGKALKSEKDYLAVKMPIVYKERNLGNIIMAYSLKEMESELNERAIVLVITNLIIFLAGLIIIIGGSTYLIRQIKTLKKSAERVGHGDFDPYINIRSADEIGQLASAISNMITSIKQSSESLLSEKLRAENAMKHAEEQSIKLEEQKDYLSKKVDLILSEMNKFAKGDLTVELDIEKDDEIGKLYKGFNNAVVNTREMILSVSDSVQRTASAANQISSSSEQLASGSVEQSRQTTEVTGSIEEITKTILESAKHAGVASENSKLASESAKEGAQKVEETKKGMFKIVSSTRAAGEKISLLSGKTEQIGQITQVIDDIADQTNLLALNAAIEAARAGEQGRGFAVVADEVRKLAERTTKATKEIADTIKSIQLEAKQADHAMNEAEKSVEEGMTLTEQVADSLNHILEVNQKVNDMINMVAYSGEEQSKNAEEISRNIEGINNITQQSSAGTQQIAKAAEELNRLTDDLQGLINRFKLSEEKSKISLSGRSRLAVRENGRMVLTN